MLKRFESGAQKRKMKKEKEAFQNQLPKLTKYFSPNLEIADTCSESKSSISDENKNYESDNQSHSADEYQNCDKVIDDPNGHNNCDYKESNQSENNVKSLLLQSDDNINTGFLHRDPALWPLKLNQNERERSKYLAKEYSFFQNRNSNFKYSKREYSKQNRYFSPKYFQKNLTNGEKCERKWLMYSESTGNIFCYVCKLFSNDHNNVFVKGGFSNWKKADEVISNHENSKQHNQCMIDWVNFMQKDVHVDKNMVNMMQSEMKYWTKILRRILAVIKFLAERGLAFRGTDEIFGSINNGNYLGVLELIAEFDPYLKQHINDYANKGRGNVSYLSKTICEEFIDLMAKQILNHIKAEIKAAKYWGLIVDSTPDISHVDQLSVIFRYYLNGHVYERFFCFLQIKSHKGKSLSIEILDLLKEHGINIADCRAQTYDNASNMSGKYSGLQACLKEQNKLAFYVPCVGHSLNLVGECSADECIHSMNYFGLLQRLYTFFSASTYRWSILKDTNSKLKNLSATRWSCRADASKDLVENFDEICKALSSIAEDEDQKSDTRNESASLLSNTIKLENVFMAVLWNRILNQFNKVSKFLQKIELDLITANSMLLSLVEFLKSLREEFLSMENESKNLSSIVEQNYSDAEKRRLTKKLCNGEKEAEILNKSDKFRVKTFYVIIDKLITELTKRSEAYDQITRLFGFLPNLLTIDTTAEIEISAKNLVEVYSQDLDDRLLYELKQFIPLLKLQPEGFFSNRREKNKQNNICPLIVLNWIVDRNMIDVFPNIYIAYRLFLTVPIANCEAERSFSVLKRIKNVYRSTMLDSRLNSIGRLAIETELFRSLEFDDLIKEFATAKCRRKCFNRI